MKKTVFLFLLLLMIHVPAFAGQDIIMAEQESEDSITYVIAGQGYSCFKSFIKWTDSNNNTEYWFRISTMLRDRLKPSIDLIIDGESYKLFAVKEYKKRHLKSSSGTEGNFYNLEDFECYTIPQELINKFSTCNNLELIATSQRRTNMKLPSNSYFINGIKEIINLKYENREPFFLNNTKVKISDDIL